jgi:hypothetical protein
MLQGVFNLSHNSKACQVSYGPTNLDMQLGDRNTALQLWWQNSHVNKEVPILIGRSGFVD